MSQTGSMWRELRPGAQGAPRNASELFEKFGLEFGIYSARLEQASPTPPGARGACLKDIKLVLEQKIREFRICQQQVACLRIVLPLLVDEGDDRPQEISPDSAQPLPESARFHSAPGLSKPETTETKTELPCEPPAPAPGLKRWP
jgi:hypothetical protein